jgi:hypothetical protein
MTPVCIKMLERSRKINTLVFQRLSSVGQVEVSRQLGVSEPTISRLKNEHLEAVCQMLAVLNLKVVPIEMKCFEPRKIEILMELARDHLNQLESVEQLTWT